MEIAAAAIALLDDPLALRLRGGGPDAEVGWRARYRDDEGVVWRAGAADPARLGLTWSAGAGSRRLAALGSLRPVRIDVRAEVAGGPSANRTITRRLADDGVQQRRWRDGLTATLHLPAAPAHATVLLDATGEPEAASAAALAAPLLASRGALVLAVLPGRGRTGATDPLGLARERLLAMAGAPREIVAVVPPVPPGVGVRRDDEAAAEARAAAWDDLLTRLGARPRA